MMHLVLFDGEEHFEAALRRLAAWHRDALTEQILAQAVEKRSPDRCRILMISIFVGGTCSSAVFGLALAGFVMPVIVVIATRLNLPLSESGLWRWVVSAVILACMGAVWRISHWLVPAGPRVRRPPP